jgi:hypothetical protein
MSNLWRAAFWAAAFLLAFQPRADAQTSPNDTAEFVAYCNDANFDVCRLRVVNVNNIMLMRQIGHNHGCTFPRPSGSKPGGIHADSIPATKAILDWLRANAASRPADTGLAIAQAMEKLWPGNCEY